MTRLLRRKIRRILVDVDTQYDLVYGDELDRSEFLRQVRRLMAWARVRSVPVISTALAHRTGSYHGNGACLEGTDGQKKIHYTILPDHQLFEAENRFDLPRNILKLHQQVIFEKRTEDPFELPRADRLFTELRPDEYLVFGMGAERAVKATVLGLLCRQKKVYVVQDAVECFNDRDGALALRQMEAKGARLIYARALTGKSRLQGGVRQRLRSQLLLKK